MLRPVAGLVALVLAAPALAQGPGRPVIDMHLHAHSLADYGGGMLVCGNRGTLEFPASTRNRGSASRASS